MKLSRLAILVVVLAAAACNAPLTQPSPTPSPSPMVDTGWETVAEGVDYRQMPMPSSYGETLARIVRVDLSINDFEVHYAPDDARSVGAWHNDLACTVATINAGFFLPDNSTLGLIVAGGEAAGNSFNRVGGMLSTDGEGISLRALSQEPYAADEPLEHAVQGRPMLIFPGGEPTSFTTNGEPERRTVVALDEEGHLLLMVFPTASVNLLELQDWLASLTDPRIEAALNLDGGGSTGMVLETTVRTERIASFTPVPSVIAIIPQGCE